MGWVLSFVLSASAFCVFSGGCVSCFLGRLGGCVLARFYIPLSFFAPIL